MIRHISLAGRPRAAGEVAMGKIVMIAALVVIGVVAGFVVRLLLPGRALGSGGN